MINVDPTKEERDAGWDWSSKNRYMRARLKHSAFLRYEISKLYNLRIRLSHQIDMLREPIQPATLAAYRDVLDHHLP